MGTLVELLPPGPGLAAELAARGVTVTKEEARAAMRAEIAFYRAHLHEARDDASLAVLRRRCAAVLGDALPPPARALGPGALHDVLLGALRFRAFGEVPDVLRALRTRGARLVVVSNWDASLPEVLQRTGLAELVDGAVASAVLGAAKPDPAIFAAGLALAGVPAARAVHAGDDLRADVAGARAAGLRAVLVAREGGVEPPPGVPAVATLRGLLDLDA